MPGPGAYWIGEEETKEIMEVMQSKYPFRYGDLSDPSFVHKVYSLEQEFAKYCGVPHALVTSSGTGSLLISLQALGVKPGDEVIVPAYTFVATFTTTIAAGAVPVLCEVDESLTMDPNDIEHRITNKTKAIMPVHMLGNPCKMDEIMTIAKKHNLLVLEDACQAAGASYQGKKIGTIGEMGAFSLNIFKTINTGDGGLVISSDEHLYKRAFGFHDQGHFPNRSGVEVGERDILGLNFRASEFVGAVGLAQLRKLDKIVSTLHAKKKKLKDLISDLPGIQFRELNDARGECGTMLVVMFNSAEQATQVSKAVKSTTLDHSGWHVYANMEHVNAHLESVGQPHGKGAYPKTDDILSRSMILSIGVVDGGVGAGFGINIDSSEEEIQSVATTFRQAYESATSAAVS